MSTTLVSDDFQSTDSVSSSNPFHQRNQNSWSRNTTEATSPTMVHTDGFKLKAYNKDPFFLSQPQQSGYWQDEPVLSNTNEFLDVFPQPKSSVIDTEIENLLSLIQPNAVSGYCMTQFFYEAFPLNFVYFVNRRQRKAETQLYFFLFNKLK